jgi:hypothetical protein
MEYRIKYILLALLITASSCKESFLDVRPEDRITEESFWKDEQDTYMALYGIYNTLKDRHVYGYGGGFDASSPNAYQWAHWEGMEMQVGNGTIMPGNAGIVVERWRDCYKGINRANYFLENVDKVEMDAASKEIIKGEAYFLRGVFYALLVNSYGGVPIINKPISVEESRQLARASQEETWAQVHSDYDEAIKRLKVQAPVVGRATLGAAYGMKMRAYLYQGQWDQVIEYADKIIGLGIYNLFPSYQGLFQLSNENNPEVIFDIQYMDGPFSQGSVFDRYWQPQNLKFGIPGSNSVAPIQNLVDAYETIDGSPVDPANPYSNRDPRLDFTILRPGAYFQGQLYPQEIANHTGQRVGFGIRKYTIETQKVIPLESPLNFIILRFADVLLSKAEALIQRSTPDVASAVALINKIRTERNDVKLLPLESNLSVTEARLKVQHERRIEFALEGLYWDDVRRWGIGPDIYPIEVRGANGELIDKKFANGYDVKKNNFLPIPDSEISLNSNLIQNFGY